MDKNRKSKATSKWVTVPVDDVLHGEVRSQAVRLHKDWPTVVKEAMKLWLAVQRRTTTT